MKKLLFSAGVTIAFLSCNNSGQQSTSEGSGAASSYRDTISDSRGTRGTGSDLNGGTPGPGTITDTFKGKTDTSDHTSNKQKD